MTIVTPALPSFPSSPASGIWARMRVSTRIRLGKLDPEDCLMEAVARPVRTQVAGLAGGAE